MSWMSSSHQENLGIGRSGHPIPREVVHMPHLEKLKVAYVQMMNKLTFYQCLDSGSSTTLRNHCFRVLTVVQCGDVLALRQDPLRSFHQKESNLCSPHTS